MTFTEILSLLFARAASGVPEFDFVTPAEVESWEVGSLEACLSIGLLRPASPSPTVLCPACDEGHEAEVVLLPSSAGRPPRAYVKCPSYGMVAVNPGAQRRWRIDLGGFARSLASMLTGAAGTELGEGLWHLGRLRADGPAWDVLFFLGRGAFPRHKLIGFAHPLVILGGDLEGLSELPHLPITRLVTIQGPDAVLDHDVLSTILASTGEYLPAFLFRRKGRLWQVVYEGRELPPLTDLKGLRYLAFLLRHQDRDFTPLVLVAELELGDAYEEPEQEDEVGRERRPPPRAIDRGLPAIEGSTLLKIKKLRAEYDEKLDKAQRHGDEAAAARLSAEPNAMVREYLTATDRWGKPRLIHSSAVKAANSVTKNITRAITRIEEHDTALGQHLNRYVTRASTCVYRPPTPIPWVF